MNPKLDTPSRREFRLLVNDLRDPRRLVWLLVAAVIFGGLEWLIMHADRAQEHINSLLILILLIGPQFSSWTLSLLHRPGRAEEYLMLPATLREKLVSRLLLTVVGLPLLWTLWATLIGAIGVVAGISSTYFNPFECWSAWGLILYIAYSTGCLMSSVWYSSRNGFKAVLQIFSIVILLISAPIISILGLGKFGLVPISLGFAMNIVPYFSIILHSDSPQIETFLFSSISALSAFFVYLTYLRMREIEA